MISEDRPDGEGKSSHGTLKNNASQRPQQLNAAEPAEKRKRILQACDECRRKKIKCDGKKPCIHCAVYDYKCTYDVSFKRGRNTSPRQIEALETRLQKAEALLRILEPSLDLNELYLNTNNAEQIAKKLRPDTVDPSIDGHDTKSTESSDDPILTTMMENFGALDLDDKGRWNYHGHSSTIIFMRRLQNQFGNLTTPVSTAFGSGFPVHGSDLGIWLRQSVDQDPSVSLMYDLPPEAEARELCRTSFSQACVLHRFVHEPSFWASFDRIYATSWIGCGPEERTFLPLLYATLAVGCLFSDAGNSASAPRYNPLFEKGFSYFRTCQKLLDPTNCRDLTSLQVIIFMIIFLQSSTELCACYPYIGIALRAALHLGLHRNIQGNFNPIERELRKRIFWTIRSMDVYVSTRRGLPISVDNDDIDQEYPLEIDDEFITQVGILPMPSSRTSLIAGTNAQNRLLDIIIEVVKTVYPVKVARCQEKPDHTYMVSYSKIQEIEVSLQAWEDHVSSTLNTKERNVPSSPPAMERMAQLLRLAHAHVQWTMYRPFLHFASNGFQAEGIDRRPYLCAAACVSASRKIIQIVREMHRQKLLNGSYWFPTHATYFATLTLVYFILENRQQSTVRQDDLKAAFEGKAVLEDLARNSLATDRCSSLRVNADKSKRSSNAVNNPQSLFKHLPEKIQSSGNDLGIDDAYRPGPHVSTQSSSQVFVNAENPSSSPNTLANNQSVPVLVLDQPTIWSDWPPSQHHEAGQQIPDLMPMFLPSGYDTVQTDNIDFTGFAPGDMAIFDEMCMRFGMDRYYTNNQG